MSFLFTLHICKEVVTYFSGISTGSFYFFYRITKLEELVAVSGRLLAGFHQELGECQ